MKSIIAIDPGDQVSAYLVWDGKQIYEKGIIDNQQLCGTIRSHTTKTVIEMVASYGMPVGKTVFETCVWIGRFIECSFSYDLIYRKDIKMHICNSMRAKDSNIRQALIDRFGPPGVKKDPGLTYGLKKDLWSAFAVAVTWWDENRHRKNSFVAQEAT